MANEQQTIEVDADGFAKKLSAIAFDSKRWKSAMPKNISRRQIGKIVGYTHANLSSIEKGRSEPGLLLLARYAVLTGRPIEYFFKGIPKLDGGQNGK